MDNCSAIYPQMNHADGESTMPGSVMFLLANQVYGSTQGRFAKITIGQRSVQEARRMWLRFVSQYSSLVLTRESDRPYAVAGIARRVQEVTGDTYLAGLGLEDLPRVCPANVVLDSKEKTGNSIVVLDVPRETPSGGVSLGDVYSYWW